MLYETAFRLYFEVRRLRKNRFSVKEYRLCQDILAGSGFSGQGSVDNFDNIFAFVLWRLAWERSSAFNENSLIWPKRRTPFTVIEWLASGHVAYEEKTAGLLGQFSSELSDPHLRCLTLARWLQKNGGVLISMTTLKVLITRFCIKMPKKSKFNARHPGS